MTIKVYISGISGSQDVRKTQQRVLFILSMLPVEMEIIDITEPGRENEKAFMQEEARKHNKKDVLPPQIFNGDQYCGNYDDFQLAADDDVLMSFLKLEEPSTNNIANGSADTKEHEPVVTQNGLGGDEETVTAQVDSQEVPPEEKQETEAAVENEAVQPGENKIDVSNADEESKPDSGDAPKEETEEKLGTTEGEKSGGDKTQESEEEEEESEEESD